MLDFIRHEVNSLSFKKSSYFENRQDDRIENVSLCTNFYHKTKEFSPEDGDNNKKYFKSFLSTEIKSDENSAHHLSLTTEIVSLFSVDKDLDEKTYKIFKENAAPAIVFPYLRTFIHVVTTQAGEGILLPIINPQSLKPKKEKETLCDSQIVWAIKPETEDLSAYFQVYCCTQKRTFIMNFSNVCDSGDNSCREVLGFFDFKGSDDEEIIKIMDEGENDSNPNLDLYLELRDIAIDLKNEYLEKLSEIGEKKC